MALDVKQKLAQYSVQDSSTKQPDQRIMELPQQRKRQKKKKKKSAHIASGNARGVGSGCAVGPSSAFPISQPNNNPTVQSTAKSSNSPVQGRKGSANRLLNKWADSFKQVLVLRFVRVISALRL